MDFMNSQFAADAIIAYMKKGNYPDSGDSYALDRKPLIDNLRQSISGDDISWVLKLIDSPTEHLGDLLSVY